MPLVLQAPGLAIFVSLASTLADVSPRTLAIEDMVQTVSVHVMSLYSPKWDQFGKHVFDFMASDNNRLFTPQLLTAGAFETYDSTNGAFQERAQLTVECFNKTIVGENRMTTTDCAIAGNKIDAPEIVP